MALGPLTEKHITRLNWTKRGFAILLSLCLGIFSWHKIYNGHIEAYEWPIFLAPMFTYFVAVLIFLDYIIDSYIEHRKPDHSSADTSDNEITVILASLCCLAITTFFCLMLSEFHHWELHLVFMAALFVVFLIWDFVVLANTSIEEHRQQVIAGNHLVNRPTLFAILTAWVLLEFVDLYPSNLMLVNEASTEDDYSLAISAQDIFVAGIISFHLVVSSIGYFSTALGVVIGENLGSGNGLLKWPHFVISWVPPGPNQDEKSEG